MRQPILLTILISLWLPLAVIAATPITYQGQLQDSNGPVTDLVDMDFRLFDSLTGGNQIGDPVPLTGVPVEDGLFQVELDFGAGAFDGNEHWLEIEVAGNILDPRQRITPAPMAVRALNVPEQIVTGLTGGEGIAPATIDDGATLSVVWGDATDLAVGGTVLWQNASALGSGGSIADFSDAAELNADGSLSVNVVKSLTGGDGIAPATIGDGAILSVVWGDATDLAAGGTVLWQNAAALGAGGSIADFSDAVDLDATGAVTADFVKSLTGGNGINPAAIGDGATLSLDTSVTDGLYWRQRGNAGTDPANDFLGTTDAVPFEIHVNGERALRLEPAVVPNIIGGWTGNTAATGIKGATISGGGCPNLFTVVCGSETPNQVTADFGAIGGGVGNTASGTLATVGGGSENVASELYATVGGGFRNAASNYATIGGGEANTASDTHATVGGGLGNAASGTHATAGGGEANTASGDFSAVPGGKDAAATQYGQRAHASGRFAVRGDAQSATYTLRNGTTNAGQTVKLFLDGNTERLNLEAGRSLAFDIQAVARSVSGKTGSWHIQGAIKNVGGTVGLVGTPDVTSHVDLELGNVTVVADNTNNALVIEATAHGNNTEDTQWVATVRATETKM